MKRLRLLALSSDRQILLRQMMRMGCVQVDDPRTPLASPEWPALLSKGESLQGTRQNELNEARSALEILMRHAGIKNSMFAVRPVLQEETLSDDSRMTKARAVVASLLEKSRHMAALKAETGRLQSQAAMLRPWVSLDAPLSLPPMKDCLAWFCVCPASVDVKALSDEYVGTVRAGAFALVSSDKEQHYFFVMLHSSSEEEALGVLKPAGFSKVVWKDTEGTARVNLTAVETKMADGETEIEKISASIAAMAEQKAELELLIDHLSVELAREEAAGRLLSTGSTFFLEGWLPDPAWPKVQKMLARYDCAYDVAEPTEEDKPPIMLKNNAFVRPFTMVTKMYSMPDYRNIDPNPLIAPFYAVFFGMMFADVAYGMILMALGLFVTLKVKPKGPMVRYMFPLMTICGAFSVFWGLMFGGFFSDAIGVISSTFFGREITFSPLWLDPLKDPMSVLIVACAMGVVHIIVGMAVKFFILWRDGSPLDAILDVVPWWIVFAGIAVVALGGTPMVMIAGFALLVLTQGRKNKGIVKKVFGGLASLYDITAYLSDILSYSRLMALGLAGGVLGMVFNKMGAMMGGGIVGILFFIVIFLFGHIFNMGMSIIGTYVHAARLMYIEYFGKFYVGGGTEFSPLSIRTKYVDIMIKE